MQIPSVSLHSSKLRLCKAFLAAYKEERTCLDVQLEGGQIVQAAYDNSVIAIDRDIEYLHGQIKALQDVNDPVVPAFKTRNGSDRSVEL